MEITYATYFKLPKPKLRKTINCLVIIHNDNDTYTFDFASKETRTIPDK